MSGVSGKPRIPIAWWAIAAVLLVAGAAFLMLVGRSTQQKTLSYSAFLDQVDAGHVASVTFTGTDISGQLKRPPGINGNNTTPSTFRSKVPDFGDPGLIPELRSHHVAITVAVPSSWAWLLSRLPLPMLLFLAVMIIVAFVRILRGGAAAPASGPMAFPAHGIMGLVSRLFAPREEPPRTGDGAEKRKPDTEAP